MKLHNFEIEHFTGFLILGQNFLLLEQKMITGVTIGNHSFYQPYLPCLIKPNLEMQRFIMIPLQPDIVKLLKNHANNDIVT